MAKKLTVGAVRRALEGLDDDMILGVAVDGRDDTDTAYSYEEPSLHDYSEDAEYDGTEPWAMLSFPGESRMQVICKQSPWKARPN